jgi:drug/metabolite transporter (DMT)-like permease
MGKTKFKGVLMLLITALVWGASFVAQSIGMESVEAFTYNGIRTLLGAAVLLPFVLIRDKLSIKNGKKTKAEISEENKKVLKIGSLLGVVFCIATNLQQFAFNFTGAGRIAFITATYMFLVPIIGLFLFRKRVPLLTWISVLIGTVGTYFLCIDPTSPGSFNMGDILSFGCAVFFALHILLIEKLGSDLDGVKLSCMQFLVGGGISVLCMFIFETPDVSSIMSATLPILYSGVMSCGVAYTFQIVGQKYTEATVASLLMCMESVFAVICSAILLSERMLPREILGCAIMFGAIIISQISDSPLLKNLKTKK